MDLGKIRAKMGEIVTTLPNSYQIVSCDCWNDKTYYNSLHPDCKYEQGLRGANIALAVNGEAGMTLGQATGPIVESVTFSSDGKTATIKFDNIGLGLKSYGNVLKGVKVITNTAWTTPLSAVISTSDTIDGGELKGFLGCPAVNKPTLKVTATITGKDTVEVKAMSEMRGVAYNAVSENYFGYQINLANSYGQPAGAFMLPRE